MDKWEHIPAILKHVTYSFQSLSSCTSPFTWYFIFITWTCAHLNDPGAVGEGHDVPLLPEESRVRALDHLELVELLHGVDLLRGLVSDLRQRTGGFLSIRCAHGDNGTRTIATGW